MAIFYTILILFVLAVALSIILWAGSLLLQWWLYETPASKLYWRAPAVGAGIVLFLAVWIIVDCRTGGRVQPFQRTSVHETKPYDTLKAVLTPKGPEETFKRVGSADERLNYRLDGQRDGKVLPARPERIIVDDGGTPVGFEPERDAQGHFKTQAGENLRYFDKSGRVMVEGQLGEVSQFRWDLLLLNVLFNVLHLALWFAGLWLVLRFQWAHALGFAVCLWLVMTLLPAPMVLDYAQQAFHVATVK
jgi:hypothetical protein